MAAGMERYPSGPIERYPSDLLVSVEADDAVLMREGSMLMREESMESLYMEYFLDSSLQRDSSLDDLYRNDSINPDILQPGFASGFPEGGNYILTKDARAFADPSVCDIAISTMIVSEMVLEDDVSPVMQLDDGDFAKDAVAPVAIMDDVHGVHMDLSDTHFAGTTGVNQEDPMLDTLVADTISRVPTPEYSHDVVLHLEKAGVIPKVLDRFTPTTTVRVIFENNVEIRNGMKVMASDMSKPPMVEIEGAFVMPGTLYTIMFIAYNEQNGERLHWLHVNYQGPQSIASAVARAGADVVHYKEPKAAANLAFLLFRQRKRLVARVAHAQDEVSARGFTAGHDLTPVGALCFGTA